VHFALHQLVTIAPCKVMRSGTNRATNRPSARWLRFFLVGHEIPTQARSSNSGEIATRIIGYRILPVRGQSIHRVVKTHLDVPSAGVFLACACRDRPSAFVPTRRALLDQSSFSFEVLHGSLVALGSFPRREGAQVSAFARTRAAFARVETILARLQFSDHLNETFRSRRTDESLR
jgi:hypothetical protein